METCHDREKQCWSSSHAFHTPLVGAAAVPVVGVVPELFGPRRLRQVAPVGARVAVALTLAAALCLSKADTTAADGRRRRRHQRLHGVNSSTALVVVSLYHPRHVVCTQPPHVIYITNSVCNMQHPLSTSAIV